MWLVLFIMSSNISYGKTFHLVYNTQGYMKSLPIFEMAVNANSFEEALDKNAVKCFDRIVGENKMGPSQKIEVIDVCVNPRIVNE